ncbi:MAG: isopentenyl transferase family protein, partial [Clostridia bacterium]
MRKIFGILGATAVGKSDIAYEIAQRLDCPLISADSMQIYKKFDIGTAKPSIEEQQKVKYYGIDIVDASLEFNSYKYVKYLEDEVLNIINNADDIPLIVGGTGLYFDSLLHPLDFRTDEFTFATRLEMTDLFNNKGIEPLKDILRKYNSDIDNKIDWNNTKRVIRAIEIYRSGGEPYANTLSCKSDKYENVLIVLERD